MISQLKSDLKSLKEEIKVSKQEFRQSKSNNSKTSFRQITDSFIENINKIEWQRVKFSDNRGKSNLVNGPYDKEELKAFEKDLSGISRGNNEKTTKPKLVEMLFQHLASYISQKGLPEHHPGEDFYQWCSAASNQQSQL